MSKRETPPTINEETRRSHFQDTHSKHLEGNHRAKYKKFVGGNVDYRFKVYFTQRFKKEDTIRKEQQKDAQTQCLDCAVYWEAGIVYALAANACSRRKRMNKERHDVLSISSYVIKENPTTEPDMVIFAAVHVSQST